MKTFAKSGLFALFLLIGIGLLSSSCGRIKDSTAKITVIDSTTGLPVTNATVKVRPESSYATPPADFQWEEREAQTDASGVATFNFNEDYEAGQAGLLVLTIDVTVGGTDYTSVGIIKVEEQQTNEKTVEVP